MRIIFLPFCVLFSTLTASDLRSRAGLLFKNKKEFSEIKNTKIRDPII